MSDLMATAVLSRAGDGRRRKRHGRAVVMRAGLCPSFGPPRALTVAPADTAQLIPRIGGTRAYLADLIDLQDTPYSDAIQSASVYMHRVTTKLLGAKTANLWPGWPRYASPQATGGS